VARALDQCCLNNSAAQIRTRLFLGAPLTHTHSTAGQMRERLGEFIVCSLTLSLGPKLAPGCKLRRIPRQQMTVCSCECLLIAMETHLHPPISVGNRHPERVIGLA